MRPTKSCAAAASKRASAWSSATSRGSWPTNSRAKQPASLRDRCRRSQSERVPEEPCGGGLLRASRDRASRRFRRSAVLELFRELDRLRYVAGHGRVARGCSPPAVVRHLKPIGGVVCLGRPEQAPGKAVPVDTLTAWLASAELGEQAKITGEGSWATAHARRSARCGKLDAPVRRRRQHRDQPGAASPRRTWACCGSAIRARR